MKLRREISAVASGKTGVCVDQRGDGCRISRGSDKFFGKTQKLDHAEKPTASLAMKKLFRDRIV
ncbi:hypothetical protein [Pseudomonas sp. MHK4]|jgi:hypothetical protein